MQDLERAGISFDCFKVTIFIESHCYGGSLQHGFSCPIITGCSENALVMHKTCFFCQSCRFSRVVYVGSFSVPQSVRIGGNNR